MAEYSLGEAILGTAVDTTGLSDGIASAHDKAQSGFSKIGDIIGGALKVGLAVAAGGFLALGGAIVSGIGDAREAAIIMGQTEAAITSTGGAAGKTAEQIGDLASSLSAAEGKSLFGDSDIQLAENLLLTFTNLKGEIFDSATAISVDMAQALGGAPKDQAIALGKALNDPIAGVTALTRVGVTFTEEQKAQIQAMQEAGDMAGAQKVILAELNKEFGGSAEAAARADGGMAQFNDRLGEIAEGVGGALLPVLNQFMGFLNDTLLPIVETVGGQLATAFQTGDFSGLLSSLSDLGSNLGTTFGQFAERAGRWILDALPGFLANAQTFFQGMVAWVAENGPGWAAALAEFGIKAVSWIGEQLPGLAASLGQLYNTMITWVVDSLPGWGTQLAELGGKIIQWVLDALPGLGTNLGAALGVLLGWIVQTAIDVVPKLAELGVRFINWVASEVIPNLPGTLLTIATAIYNFISEVVKEVGPKLAVVAEKFLSWVETDVIPYLSGKLDAIKTAISTWVTDKVGWAKNELARIGAAIVAGLRAGVEGAWGSFLAWIDEQIQKIPQVVRDILGIGSPSRVFAEIGSNTIAGWLEGLQASFPDLLSEFESMGEELADVAEKIRDTISDTMADIFSSGASIYQQRAKNRDFIAELGKDVTTERKKVQKEIAATEDKLAKERAKEKPDEGRIKELEAELKLLQEQEAALKERERQMQSFRQRQENLATQAEQTAAALFADDPKRQAAFFALRSKQIQQLAKLEERWFAATSDAERKQIEANIEDVKKAQELEIAAFMEEARQGNATFGDLTDEYDDLVKKREDMLEKRAELESQLANEKDDERRAALQAEIDALNYQIDGLSELITEIEALIAVLTVTTEATTNSTASIATMSVASSGASKNAGTLINAGDNTLTINIDARGAMDPDAVEAAARRGAEAAMREAAWRGDTRSR